MTRRKVNDDVKMISLRIWLPQKWQDAITQHAKNLGISRAEFVRNCIEPHVPKDIFVPSCRVDGCDEPVVFECWCERCRKIPYRDKFYSCEFHSNDNRLRHSDTFGSSSIFGPVKPYQKDKHE